RLDRRDAQASRGSERHEPQRGREDTRATLMAPGGIEPPRAASKAAALSAELRGPDGLLPSRVADGTRTRDHRDHNPGLYQLSYRHRAWTSYPWAGLRTVETGNPPLH